MTSTKKDKDFAVPIAEHCRLCGHQQMDINTGTICGVTNKKPHFMTSCAKISFNEKLRHNVQETNVKLEEIKARKLGVMYKLWSQSIVGSLTIFAGIYLLNLQVFYGFFAIFPFVIITAGFAAFPIGFYAFTKHKSALSATRLKKKRLDTVLNKYDITYDIQIELGKEIHGVFKPTVDTNFTRYGKPANSLLRLNK